VVGSQTLGLDYPKPGSPSAGFAKAGAILVPVDESSVDEAVASGRAFADLSAWRKVALAGSDAVAWLNDLASADIADLAPGAAKRSLLLSPTGQIRAEFTIAKTADEILLLQDPHQPSGIDELLAPYVLSSDVRLADRSGELALFAFPHRGEPLGMPETTATAPSCTGPGLDLHAPASSREAIERALLGSFARLGLDDLDRYRIAAGIPRFGVDGREEDLPEEGGFDEAVSYEKGCFLGQEAVAKVRNLGHPRRLVVHLAADDPVSAGEPIEVDGESVGEITSASERNRSWWILARVNWARREGPFRTPHGVRLTPVPHRS
jgi:hypothetical protein